MIKKDYEKILSSSISEVNDLLETALQYQKKFENKKKLTKEEVEEYDILLKYIHCLNIIIVHKQQNQDLSLDSLTNETSKAIDIIIKSGYNN